MEVDQREKDGSPVEWGDCVLPVVPSTWDDIRVVRCSRLLSGLSTNSYECSQTGSAWPAAYTRPTCRAWSRRQVFSLVYRTSGGCANRLKGAQVRRMSNQLRCLQDPLIRPFALFVVFTSNALPSQLSIRINLSPTNICIQIRSTILIRDEKNLYICIFVLSTDSFHKSTFNSSNA